MQGNDRKRKRQGLKTPEERSIETSSVFPTVVSSFNPSSNLLHTAFLSRFQSLPSLYDSTHTLCSDYMKKCAEAGYLSGEDTVCITVSVGNAAGKGKAWGCDLSYDYVRINAEYTT